MLHCHLVHSSTSLCLFCSLCLSLRVDLCMYDLSSFYRCSDVFWTWLRVHTYVPAKKYTWAIDESLPHKDTRITIQLEHQKNFWHSRKNQITLKQQNLEGVLQFNKTR